MLPEDQMEALIRLSGWDKVLGGSIQVDPSTGIRSYDIYVNTPRMTTARREDFPTFETLTHEYLDSIEQTFLMATPEEDKAYQDRMARHIEEWKWGREVSESIPKRVENLLRKAGLWGHTSSADWKKLRDSVMEDADPFPWGSDNFEATEFLPGAGTHPIFP